jgi:hypothetical protein
VWVGETGSIEARREAAASAGEGDWRPVVERTVEKFLACGDLREGFARVRCPECRPAATRGAGAAGRRPWSGCAAGVEHVREGRFAVRRREESNEVGPSGKTR